MPTIAEQLTQLASIKSDIKDAIEAKGETVGSDALSTYATHISNISGGGGGGDEIIDGMVKRTLTTFEISNNVIEVGSYAFYYFTRLTSVVIPNTVTKISNFAFYHCTGLTSISIPNSVTNFVTIFASIFDDMNF